MRADSEQSNEADALKRELEKANQTIAQLKERLISATHQLQRERAAREHAEFAAQQAANAAELAARAAVEAAHHQPSSVDADEMKYIVQRDQEWISTEIMIQQEQAARKEAELAAQEAAHAVDFDMEDVSDSPPRSPKHDGTPAVNAQRKKTPVPNTLPTPQQPRKENTTEANAKDSEAKIVIGRSAQGCSRGIGKTYPTASPCTLVKEVRWFTPQTTISRLWWHAWNRAS